MNGQLQHCFEKNVPRKISTYRDVHYLAKARSKISTNKLCKGLKVTVTHLHLQKVTQDYYEDNTDQLFDFSFSSR